MELHTLNLCNLINRSHPNKFNSKNYDKMSLHIHYNIYNYKTDYTKSRELELSYTASRNVKLCNDFGTLKVKCMSRG